ncbi:MAG: hypothetical protein KAG06_06755 [Methylococcales bacterium]|nr:hypothetical protein [Methylococcales bacterium]
MVSAVDPIAPMFLYFTIPVVLLLFALSDDGVLIGKIFIVLFALSHLVAYLSFKDAQKNSTMMHDSTPFNQNVFIKCSNAMFKAVNSETKNLMIEQKINFDRCLKQ